MQAGVDRSLKILKFTLPETNIAFENWPPQKGKCVSTNHRFSGAMLVSGRVLPRKLTYRLKMDGWNTTFHLERSLFRGRFNFLDCNMEPENQTLKRMVLLENPSFSGEPF